MISSFFTKTKPINYVVLLVFTALFYFALQFFWNPKVFHTQEIGGISVAVIVLILSVFLISELVRQNKVTELNSFAMVFFVGLTVVFPNTLLDNNGIFANFFILLATKKLLEVKEAKNAKHKIFDAAFFICVSTLFYKWALVYFIAIGFTINTFKSQNIKIWFVFLTSVVTFLLVKFGLLIAFGNEDFLISHYAFFELEIDEKSLFKKLSIKNMVFFVVIAVFAMIDFVKLRKKGGGKLVIMRSMLLFFALVVIVIFLESKESAPILLSFFPSAVFLTNFIETLRKKKFKELALGLFLITAFSVFFIENLV
jgi:hypothetical protein